MEGFWTVLANIEGPVLLWFQEVARRPGVNEAVDRKSVVEGKSVALQV